ncbi:hypothetical protein VitviT2T_008392 [Vitis vinifera]|uniref:Uncharacterized protein n=1 Tax=Vitis vinifera TaxID=29760 RepID=A0ABY9C379_VITVI|nr:hypothetical protein VitviT2T_008392 [Vitis vinifera]
MAPLKGSVSIPNALTVGSGLILSTSVISYMDTHRDISSNRRIHQVMAISDLYFL